MVDFDFAREIAHFKGLSSRGQRNWIENQYKTLTIERIAQIADWCERYANDLVEPSAYAVVAFDVWWVVTRVYDVDLPNDVAECLAEEMEAGRLAKAAQPWRNLLVRHNLPWRKFTRKDFEELRV